MIAAACFPSGVSAEQVKLEISWSLNPETEVYTNNQTKISFPKSIAGFKQTRATPADKDGSASFAYRGKEGIITVYLAHRMIHGMIGSDDCTPQFRDAFIQGMLEAHGKTDVKEFFSFSFAIEGKKITGLGVTAHFINSPQMRGPIYSEFGAVLVGDFLYYYRASFFGKAGLKDLGGFLREIGFEKRANQSSEPTPTSVTTPAAQEIAPAAVVAHL
jgi:hypothetical protein